MTKREIVEERLNKDDLGEPVECSGRATTGETRVRRLAQQGILKGHGESGTSASRKKQVGWHAEEASRKRAPVRVGRVPPAMYWWSGESEYERVRLAYYVGKG